jgi:nitroimidazol reductase NimA-like FMN-containing flavoprotein (pyridoxamine 5'-phosphate oxidase superfamily)
MDEFPLTERNRVARLPERGQYDLETIYTIIDEALTCQVAFAVDGQPYNIPTLHARRGDELLLHGAPRSRLMNQVAAGAPLCIAMTLVDGIVLAKSVFHHSINYRSVVLFGKGRLLESEDEKMAALQSFTEKVLPGRWDDARPPNAAELRVTAVATVRIDSASAKLRTGPPKDEAGDADLPVWSGVLPVKMSLGVPVPVEGMEEVPLPGYLVELLRR